MVPGTFVFVREGAWEHGRTGHYVHGFGGTFGIVIGMVTYEYTASNDVYAIVLFGDIIYDVSIMRSDVSMLELPHGETAP